MFDHSRGVTSGWRRSGRRVPFFLLLFAGAAAGPSAATVITPSGTPATAALTRTIGFDDHAPGPITNEYAAQGVTFNTAPDGSPEGNAYIVSTPATARSAPNSLFIGCGVEICPAHTVIDFTAPHRFVDVYAGTNNTGTTTVDITAYDLSGNVVSGDTYDIGQTERTRLHVMSTAGDIWYVRVASTHGSKYVYLDDLTFDVPSGGPPPDFGIVAPGGFGVQIRSGTVQNPSLILRRRNGSTGPINLSLASPLPAGVRLTFPANPVNGPDGSAVPLHVEAPLGTPPVVRFGVRITGTPTAASAGPSSRTVTLPISVADSLSDYDLRARGIEITQAIQPGGPADPLPSSTPTPTPGVFRYTGVPLAYGHQTLVRVYADARNANPTVQDVDARLYGWDAAGRPLPGSPLMPNDGTHTLVGRHTNSITYEERQQSRQPFPFMLPVTWTGGPLRLRAALIPRPAFWDEARPIECLSPACAANNSTELTGIDFRIMSNEEITPVHLVYRGNDEPAPAAVYADAQAVMPIGIITPWYRGEINVDGIVYNDHPGGGDNRDDRSSAILDALEDWNDDRGETGTVIVGIGSWMYKSAPAANAGPCTADCTDSAMESGDPVGFGDNQPYAVVNDKRSLDSVAHELGHALGRKHASPACGGDKNEFEPWPPDNRGQLQGMGVDVREKPDWSHAIYGDVHTDDYMSYCDDTGGRWTSVRGWADLANGYRLPSSRTSTVMQPQTAAGAVSPLLRVAGEITSSGARITRVRPASRAIHGGSSSPIFISARAGGNTTISTVPADVVVTHVDQGGHVMMFTATVPAAGVQSVVATRDRTVLATRTRSAHAPSARILSPGRGSRVGRGKRTLIRWRATDADGGKLTVAIDYSANNGRTWDPMYAGPNSSRAKLPSRFFSAAQRARLRLRVSDGFNQTIALSAAFRAAGAPPLVGIASPRAARLPNDAALVLRGEAFDDRGRALGGRSLRWYFRRRLIARGAGATVAGLSAGRGQLRLVARDRLGRTGSAAVRMRITATRPQFLVATAPHVLARDAKSVSLKVAASLPSQLKVGTHKYRVGRRTRTVVVPISPGSSTLVLKLELIASKLREFRTIEIGRM